MIAAAVIACSLVTVIDGDTFRCDGRPVRIADIDAPELHRAQCDAERRLAGLARDRLAALLSGGRIEIRVRDPATGRTADRHGRVLGLVTAAGVPVGKTLVNERLARPWNGRREPWCEETRE